MKRPTISQTALTATSVPFALLLATALLAAEVSDALDHSRLIYSSWVSLVFAAPALCLFVFPRKRDGEYERLTWTFSFLAYLVHFYYAFGVTYQWSFAKTYAGQGPVIATSNLALTMIWTFDVVASWCAPGDLRWLAIERVVARAFVLVTFIVSAVVIFDGFVRVLGILMLVSLFVCVAIRVVQASISRGAGSAPSPLSTGTSAG